MDLELVKIDMGERRSWQSDPQTAEMIKATMSEVLGMKIKSPGAAQRRGRQGHPRVPAKLPADAASMTDRAAGENSPNMTRACGQGLGVGGKRMVHRKMKSGGMVMARPRPTRSSRSTATRCPLLRRHAERREEDRHGRPGLDDGALSILTTAP